MLLDKAMRTELPALHTGLFGLPLWAFTRHALPGSVFSSPLLGAVIVVGRLVCLSVETWVVSSYLGRLLERDCQQVRNSG